MAIETAAARESAARELTITRIFDAPRALLWKAWCEPERMVHWMGPEGCTATIERLDGLPGGSYRFHLRGPNGDDHWAQGVHREIVELERLVYTWAWADAEGRPTGPETLITVTFEELDGKSRLTLRQVGFDSDAARESHRGGWSSSFNCLAEYLARAQGNMSQH